MKIICYHHHLTIILSNWNQYIIIVPDKRLQVDFFIARLTVSVLNKLSIKHLSKKSYSNRIIIKNVVKTAPKKRVGDVELLIQTGSGDREFEGSKRRLEYLLLSRKNTTPVRIICV